MHLLPFFAAPEGKCAGTLVSPRVVLSAVHCIVKRATGEFCPEQNYEKLLFVILGAHRLKPKQTSTYYRENYKTIPVVDVRAPDGAFLSGDLNSHDFVMLILLVPITEFYRNKYSNGCF